MGHETSWPPVTFGGGQGGAGAAPAHFRKLSLIIQFFLLIDCLYMRRQNKTCYYHYYYLFLFPYFLMYFFIFFFLFFSLLLFFFYINPHQVLSCSRSHCVTKFVTFKMAPTLLFPSSLQLFSLISQIDELTNTLQQYKKEAGNVQRSLKLLQEAFDEIVRTRRTELVSGRWYCVETYCLGSCRPQISLMDGVYNISNVFPIRSNTQRHTSLYICLSMPKNFSVFMGTLASMEV